MQLSEGLHRIKIDFQVTEAIKRFVCLYLIDGGEGNIQLIDTGVNGNERDIAEYLHTIGRDIGEIANVFLTHSHPDHMGSAAALKRIIPGCKLFAPAAERQWIEDIDSQFKARPIPNFYALVGASVSIDEKLEGGDIVEAAAGVTLRAVDARGHSHGSLAYLWLEQGALFTGDAVPVAGDIPIFTSLDDSIATLESFSQLDKLTALHPAWDESSRGEAVRQVIARSVEHLLVIKEAVRTVCREADNLPDEEAFALVCRKLKAERLQDNPLFRKSISVALDEYRRG